MFSKIKFVVLCLICTLGLNLSPMFGNSHECLHEYSQPEYAGAVIDGKYYIVPGSVYVAPNGIYINVCGNFVPISCLRVDEHGVYTVEVIGVCPYCGWATIGGFCLNPNCPRKG